MARSILRAKEAPNDGVRQLRVLLRRETAAKLAKRIGCDATAVRRWARCIRTPTPEWRVILQQVLGIPDWAWEITSGDDDAVTRPLA